MHDCIHAGTLNPTLDIEAFLEAASAAHFEGIELNTDQALEFVEKYSIAELQRRINGLGLTAANFVIGPNAPKGAPADRRAIEKARFLGERAVYEVYSAVLRQQCALAVELGIKQGTLVLPFRRPTLDESTMDELVANVRAVADTAAPFGIEAIVEFIGLRPVVRDQYDFIWNIDTVVDLIARANRPNLGVLLDSYHWWTSGGTLGDIQKLKGLPLFVHVNDAPAVPRDELTDPMRVLMGEGVIPLADFLHALHTIGYDEWVSAEVFDPNLRGGDPFESACKVKAAMTKLLAEA